MAAESLFKPLILDAVMCNNSIFCKYAEIEVCQLACSLRPFRNTRTRCLNAQ